jgi:outer membrane protein OmpA-like peptidoglycan-associated protein
MTVSARHARSVAASAIAIAVALLAASPALAQSRTGFAVNRFEPAERGGEWFVVDALDLRGRARPALGVTFDYAYKPLAAYDAAGVERLALVRHQLFVHAGGSVVLGDRVRLGANLPLAVYQDGEDVFTAGVAWTGATAPALGDLRLAADVRAVGQHGAPFTLAVGLRGWLPTGLRSQFTSDGSARVAPQVLLAGQLGPLAWAARAAVVVRARDDSYAGSALGSELSGAAGLGLRLGGLLVGPEAFASTGLTSKDAFFGAHGTPAEALLGARYELPRGLRLSAGGGTGLTRGYGAPAFRALASIEWWVPIAPPPPDRDRDGVVDDRDACPDTPGVPSGEPDLDGCPEPEHVPQEDTDEDGVGDNDDACPGIPGPRTADPMTNGCPPSTPRQLAIVTTTEIKIGEQIPFATDSAELLGDGDAVLAAVKRVLDEHRDIAKLRVEGHTDNTGDPTYNDELSRRRAAAVVRWLVEHGVEADRLTSEGFGSKRPLGTNLTEEGRANNRRVAFTILERRAPP